MAQIRLRIDTIQTAGPFTTVIAAEEHIDCPSIILPSTSKLLVGFDLFNCVNRASQRKALMHHLTSLKVTTPKMTFNGTMRFNVSLGRLFQYTRLSVVCVSCIKYQRQHFRLHNLMCNGVIFVQYFSPRLLNQISESHHLTTLTPDIVIK